MLVVAKIIPDIRSELSLKSRTWIRMSEASVEIVNGRDGFGDEVKGSCANSGTVEGNSSVSSESSLVVTTDAAPTLHNHVKHSSNDDGEPSVTSRLNDIPVTSSDLDSDDATFVSAAGDISANSNSAHDHISGGNERSNNLTVMESQTPDSFVTCRLDDSFPDRSNATDNNGISNQDNASEQSSDEDCNGMDAADVVSRDAIPRDLDSTQPGSDDEPENDEQRGTAGETVSRSEDHGVGEPESCTETWQSTEPSFYSSTDDDAIVRSVLVQTDEESDSGSDRNDAAEEGRVRAERVRPLHPRPR